MNSREIIDYIKNPGALQTKQKDELQRLLRQYPFCSTLHQLWLKSLKNTNHQDLIDNLKYSAAFIHDRAHFFDWYHYEYKDQSINNSTDDQKEAGSASRPMTQQEQEAQMQSRLRQIEKEQNYRELNPDEKKEQQQAQKKSSGPELDDLVNKFLNDEPKIVPDKQKDYQEEEEQAQRSLQKDDELISETLARVYERQGKISKAKEIYEKLSLKFPEKKRYFADLINKLDNKQKED